MDNFHSAGNNDRRFIIDVNAAHLLFLIFSASVLYVELHNCVVPTHLYSPIINNPISIMLVHCWFITYWLSCISFYQDPITTSSFQAVCDEKPELWRLPGRTWSPTKPSSWCQWTLQSHHGTHGRFSLIMDKDKEKDNPPAQHGPNGRIWSYPPSSRAQDMITGSTSLMAASTSSLMANPANPLHSGLRGLGLSSRNWLLLKKYSLQYFS